MNKPCFDESVLSLDFDESHLSYKVEYESRNTIGLSWEKREGVVKYLLTSANGNPGGTVYEGPDTAFTHSSLKSNTEYSYFLSGESAGGKSTKPILIHARTAVREVPVAPTFFEAFGQTPTEVSFYWDAGVVDGGQPGYEIRRDGVLLDTPSRPPYTDKNPQQGKDHVYCIRTFDDEFYFSEPHCITVPIKDETAPTAPTNLRTSNLGLILSWEESYDSSGDITYTIDQGQGTQLGTTKETEFAITGLQPGQRYEFGVTASDKTGHKSERVTIQYPALGVSLQRK
ncbi:fibronectin type III domain-containing protein [Pseudomonas sp. Pseusp3]|uniref:fibronectin type III domain-containing protein n=1 Tax=unclassified Pseudomonas TaxID=196821 RepID=UPI0039B0EF49